MLDLDAQIIRVIAFDQKLGFSPSQREIAERIRRCLSVTNRHLLRLEKKGVLKIKGHRKIELYIH